MGMVGIRKIFGLLRANRLTSGRINRQEYVGRLIMIVAITIIVLYSIPIVNAFAAEAGLQLARLWILVSPFAIVAQGIKRLHDLDRPGTHYIFVLVPVYGSVVGAELLLRKGTAGANRFGEDPLACRAS